jgi:phospholipase A-2-activating protein
VKIWRGEALKQTIAVSAQAVALCLLSDGDLVVGTSDSGISVFTSDQQIIPNGSERESLNEVATQVKTKDTHNDDNKDQLQHVTVAKQHFDGKEYDFVFDVEIHEGQPSVKLPYNIGDDPRHIASTFLEHNHISHQFLERIVNFIKDHPTNTLQLAIPTSAASAGAIIKTTVNCTKNQFFPETSYIRFDQLNPQQIFGKIREFNNQAEKRGCKYFTSHEISVIESLIRGQCNSSTSTAIELLQQMLQWSHAILFPVLDALRLAVLQPAVNKHIFTPTVGSTFPQPFIAYVCTILGSSSHPKNLLLMLRVLCNAFHHSDGERWALDHTEDLISTAMSTLRESTEKPLQVAVSSLLLNLTVGHRTITKDPAAIRRCLLAAADLAQDQSDVEAHFRLLVTVGTAIADTDELLELVKTLDLENFLYWCQNEDYDKTKQCSQALQSFITC